MVDPCRSHDPGDSGGCQLSSHLHHLIDSAGQAMPVQRRPAASLRRPAPPPVRRPSRASDPCGDRSEPSVSTRAASVPSVRPVRRPSRAVRPDPCGVRPDPSRAVRRPCRCVLRPTRAATVPSRPSRPERRPSRPVRLSNNYASNRARGIYKRSHMYMICVSYVYL